MKFKPFSNKCPICDSKIKLSGKYRSNYRGLHVDCSVCGTELAPNPIMVPVVCLELVVSSALLFSTEWKVFNFIIAFIAVYLTWYTLPLLSPIPWLEDIDLSIEELRELWKKESEIRQKESGEWMRKQREQNKDD